ncbi:MAG: hypothetical protein Q6364_09085 [Candidatus Hermodarchaeota archaeon]|nr:hypothetical protein [Candidatus Hermodarchaeota archaeon]
MMGVTIETPHLKMEIKLVSIESLFIHEETIPAALKKLKQELIDEKVLHHPMIVDRETLVVLDGMHRVAALRGLGYQLAPVCLVDYQNPEIQLTAWFREFEGEVNFSNLVKSLPTKLSLDLVPTTTDIAFEQVESRKAIAALAQGTKAYLFTKPTALPIKETYDEIAKIESVTCGMSFQIVYSAGIDAIKTIQNRIRPVLIVPALTKTEVINSALNHELFIQKTTRHLVPARPLFVNVPLSWLEILDLNKANQKLAAYLKRKQIVKQDSGTVINGRRYEEHAYIFTDP